MRPRLRFVTLATAAVLALSACDGTDAPLAQVTMQDVKVGTGRAAVEGDRLRVSYEGAVQGKQAFDAGTFTFVLGAGEVLPGLERGIVGMKPGGVRRITIPPALGYGDETLRAASGYTLVPSGSTLVYTVDLNENFGPTR